MSHSMKHICLLILAILAVFPVVADTREFSLDPEASSLRVLVYKAGLMSALGHNHVITARELSGTFEYAEPLDNSSFTVRLPVAALEVDNPTARDSAGDDFPGHLSTKDIQGTTRNMLGKKLLNSASYPYIEIRATGITGTLAAIEVAAIAVVLGAEHKLTFGGSAQLRDNSLLIEGALELNHADIGLKPFSAAFGTLKVAPPMLIQFRLIAVEQTD